MSAIEVRDVYDECDNCGDIIFTYLGNPEDALIIKFEGGYGCYIDPMDVDFNTAIICKACADKLSVAFPKLSQIIQKG